MTNRRSSTDSILKIARPVWPAKRPVAPSTTLPLAAKRLLPQTPQNHPGLALLCCVFVPLGITSRAFWTYVCLRRNWCGVRPPTPNDGFRRIKNHGLCGLWIYQRFITGLLDATNSAHDKLRNIVDLRYFVRIWYWYKHFHPSKINLSILIHRVIYSK